MKINYETTLTDAVEPAYRRFRRSPRYRTNRWRGAVLSAVVYAIFGFLGFRASETLHPAAVCVAAAVLGAGVFLTTYDMTVRRRIRRYVEREFGPKLPYTTGLEIDGRTLLSTSPGRTTTLPLADLTAVTEDGQRLELAFGDKALFTIPLRAFANEADKAAFLASLGRP